MGSAASVGSNHANNIASSTNTATNSSNVNSNLTGVGGNISNNRVAKTSSDEDAHGKAHTNNRSQTLSSMIRDLMVDKRKFDRFLEKLQRSNQQNLSSNSFVPRHDDAINNTTSGGSNAPPSVANTPTLRSKRNSSTSQHGRQLAAAPSSPFLTPPSSAPQPQRGGGGYMPSLEISGYLDIDDNSSVTTHNLSNDVSLMEEDMADLEEQDQDDASKINLNASNSRVIAAEEKAAVESDYKNFLYETVSDQGSARHSEPSGMQVRQLVDLPLPGDNGAITSIIYAYSSAE